jgi:hypothetical protein
MAITTLDGALNGMQPPKFISKAVTATLVAGRPASLWSLGGSPGVGSFDTTSNGVVLSSSSSLVAGQIPHTDPVSGNSYLARFTAAATQPGTLLLLDRLWHNGNYNATTLTAQTSTTPTWPARDNAGSTNGDGVLLAVEVSAATGAGTPTLTVSYTNSSGTSGRTATNIISTVATSAIGATYFIGLQAGDTGVRSVQSLLLSATWTSGTINMVAYRLLAAMEITSAFTSNAIDALTSGFPQLYNGVVPWLVFVPNTTTATNVSGTYVETQG